ncbi:MFS transporter [Leptospira perolatii]|uniref:MFS transporter n=1 Tax=Leptospira perolatii TaxID=2023191 RepID=A0A2M9ZJ06_9LEPT|nr:peptide MFS transporter [Leptospira perolatii]PJZ69523.1 MFS transporter [Leptospira perolatii]PJZ72038.1 MFS transporter [Leptospira perolatii]
MEIESQGKLTHPKGLRILFLVEMWERFSYYGMRALLILFLTKSWSLSDSEAGRIYGIYTALVYVTPILGGFLADRYLGYKSSIYIGGILIMLGHISLAIERSGIFFLGLGFLILGNGFFKPCISTVVGKIYELEGKIDLKDAGFTIFYIGINLGAFVGSVICGFLGEKIGWHFGFGAAAIGMLFGLVMFTFQNNNIPQDAFRISLPQNQEKNADLNLQIDGDRIFAILVFSASSVAFWACFEQMGSSLNLFTDRYLDRNVFGYEIPASIFQSLNPLLIIALAPIVAWFWKFLETRNLHPETTLKFSFGMWILALGFALLSIGTFLPTEKLSIWWIFGAVLLHTIGELFVSPVGLSLVTKLSPIRFVSMMLGIWFLANFFGHLLAGELAGLMGKREDLPGFFLIFVGIPGVIGFVLFLIRKQLQAWMHGVR